MIRNKEELREYLKADRRRIPFNNKLLARFTYSESFLMYSFMTALRKVEYYQNKKKNPLEYLPYIYWFLRYRRLKIRTGFYVAENCLGKGAQLVHPGFIRMSSYVTIGDNCTILPMVLFGKKKPGIDKPDIVVGKNCYISTGVKIIGPLTIGDNVTIAAGAVVLHDIPDNCVVAGIPAKIVKHKEP